MVRERDYEILYDLKEGEQGERAVGGIRTRTTRAGNALDVECYPILRLEAPVREEVRRRRSSPAQAALNRRRAARRIRMLIEGNFDGRAFVVTLTFDYGIIRQRDMMRHEELLRAWEAQGLPVEERDAARALGNYLKRIRYHMARAGHGPGELKYLYVLETTHEPRDGDPNPLPPRFHFHMVIRAPGLTRERLKALWPWGFVQADELTLRDEGAARIAGYMTKGRGAERTRADGRRLRRWAASKNLREPTVRVSDRKVSRRAAARVAEDVRQWGREIFERLYPGYRCVELPEVRYSDFAPGAYIYARLRRN